MKGLRRGKAPAVTAPTPSTLSTRASRADTADVRAAVATLDPEDSPPGKVRLERTRGRGRAAGPPATTPDDRKATRRPFSRGTATAKPAGDVVPAVNLLSPWVLEELHVRSLRHRFAYAALALVLVLGLAWAGLNLQADRARTAAADEEAVGTALSGQIAQMAPVRVYVSGVDARAQAVTDAMTGQVAFSEVLRGLQAALPPKASLDTMTVTLPTPAAGAAAGTDPAAAAGTTATGDPATGTCPGPDPFATAAVVACLDLTGTAANREAVSTLVLRLGRNPLFAEPFVSATTASEEGEEGAGGSVAFVGSVALTAEVANTRFADLVERLGSTKTAAAATAAREAREAQQQASDAATGQTIQEQP